MDITRSHCPISVSYYMGDTRLEQSLLRNTLGLCCPPILNGALMLTRSPARLNVCLDLSGGLLVLMILSPWRNCLLLSLDQSLSIVHRFGLQTKKVTNISWKGFRGVSFCFRTFLRYQAPDSRYSHHYFPLWWRAAGDPRLARGRSRVRAAAPAGALRALFSPPFLPSSFLPHQPRGRVRVMVIVLRPIPAIRRLQVWVCSCVNPIFFFF